MLCLRNYLAAPYLHVTSFSSGIREPFPGGGGLGRVEGNRQQFLFHPRRGATFNIFVIFKVANIGCEREG